MAAKNVLTEVDRIDLFFDNLTPQTRINYEAHIPLVVGSDYRSFVRKAKKDPLTAENFLLRWLADVKNGKIKKMTTARELTNENLSAHSIRAYMASVKSLLTFCKCGVDFTEISRSLPKKGIG